MKWTMIPGFSRYKVSDHGCIHRAVQMGRGKPGPISVWISNRGYYMVDLRCDEHDRSVSRSVHSLVLLAFVGEYPAGMQVRHLDGMPWNNTLDNLRYGTPKENCADKIRHGTVVHGERVNTATLKAADVPAVVDALKQGRTYRDIATEFGCGRYAVQELALGNTWKRIAGGVRVRA